MTRGYEEEEERRIRAAAPFSRKKTSDATLLERATSIRFKPPVPGSLSLKKCYEEIDSALKLVRWDEERTDGGDCITPVFTCRWFKHVWAATALLDERLYSLAPSVQADLRVTAALFLAQLAYAQAAALHHLAPLTDQVSTAVIPLKRQNRHLTSFVTKERRFNPDETEVPLDYLEAAMRCYEAATSAFKTFRMQVPPTSKEECWNLLISTGSIRCRCDMYLLHREGDCSELSSCSRVYRVLLRLHLKLRRLSAGTHRIAPSDESTLFSPPCRRLFSTLQLPSGHYL